MISRRKWLCAGAAVAAHALLPPLAPISAVAKACQSSSRGDRIVDIHAHFDEKNPRYIESLLRVSDRLNLTACVLTPFAYRKLVAEAAKQHPGQIVPFGNVDLDTPDVVEQVQELHSMGFRGLGEMEFVRKPYTDPSYFPVYELANRFSWIVMFHTGIVLRQKFDEPEDVASHRMRAVHLEEIARRYPKITVVGAHCGNPEYEWAAEIARWNPNVFFDLSGTTLTKMRGRLGEFKNIFWWSGQPPDSKTPNNDRSAFVKIVFGSDESPDGVESVLHSYQALFDACDVPKSTRNMILGGTLAQILDLPE